MYGATIVSAVTAVGTPGVDGMASVATPEPALASSASAWPWYPPANFRMRSRFVNARASRSALIAASVPDETRRTRSTDGNASTISAASSTSASVGAPKLVPRNAAARTASTVSGSAWPKSSGPHDSTQSR